MSVLDTTPGLRKALLGEMTPKFLATRSADGRPNVVPCVSILPASDCPDTLFFGNFLLRKSIRNLQEDQRVGVLVITPALQGWLLKVDFVEFQRTGPYVEQQMNSGLLRYNAYTGIRNAGVMRVRSVEGSFQIPRWKVALDYVRARLINPAQVEHPIRIPRPVLQEFGRMVAVKVLAWIGEDGYPLVVPALSMQPAGEHELRSWLGRGQLPVPPDGAQAASNLLTFEAISYQVKGRWQASRGGGRLLVEEVYAGGPPYPGGRVA